jgi:hypothetical protein
VRVTVDYEVYVTKVPINPIILSRTRHSCRAYHPTRDITIQKIIRRASSLENTFLENRFNQWRI